MPAMKTILRPPASRVLRYGDPSLEITPTCTVHEAEPLRYARDATLGADAQMIAAIVVDAIQELPWARWAMSKMAAESQPGDGTAAAVEDADSTNVPTPAAMKKRESKIESETPVKYALRSARAPANNTWSGLPRSTAPTSPRSTPAVAVAEPDKRSRYAKLTAESQDRSLDYSRRHDAWVAASAMHAEHVDSDSSRAVADAAIRRATREGIEYDAALRIEQERTGGFSLPLPPSHAA